MTSTLRVTTIQNTNTSNIITQTNATTLTIGASGQTINVPTGATLTGPGQVLYGNQFKQQVLQQLKAMHILVILHQQVLQLHYLQHQVLETKFN